MLFYGIKQDIIIGPHLMKTTEGNIDEDYARILLYKIFGGSK